RRVSQQLRPGARARATPGPPHARLTRAAPARRSAWRPEHRSRPMPLFSKYLSPTSAPAARKASRARFDLGVARPADLYDAWLFAEADATLALAAWRSAPRGFKAD